ncbi:MAG: hypothetical protein IPK52_17635 [Chloroflexi bacterium]|nr:hypothetical protein [Chloroflexota bacterium]
MAKITVSLAQIRIAHGDIGRNVTNGERMIIEAARRGSHLVVLPELWTTGYALERANELSSAVNAGPFAQIGKLARENKICVTGSMLEKRGLEVTNSAAFFAPTGQPLGIYRKIHLFKLMNEHIHLKAGSAPLLLELPWGRTGIAICYDLRFPELFRQLCRRRRQDGHHPRRVAAGTRRTLAGTAHRPRHREPDVYCRLQCRG